jgi:hypothetical protein
MPDADDELECSEGALELMAKREEPDGGALATVQRAIDQEDFS